MEPLRHILRHGSWCCATSRKLYTFKAAKLVNGRPSLKYCHWLCFKCNIVILLLRHKADPFHTLSIIQIVDNMDLVITFNRHNIPVPRSKYGYIPLVDKSDYSDRYDKELGECVNCMNYFMCVTFPEHGLINEAYCKYCDRCRFVLLIVPVTTAYCGSHVFCIYRTMLPESLEEFISLHGIPKHIYKTALNNLLNYWAPQPVVFHWDDTQSSSSGVSTDSVPSLIALD